MNRFLLLGSTFLVALFLGACVGENKLTEGAAAGAGIGALLGMGDNATEGEATEAEPIVEEEGVRYFGPAQ